MQLRIAAATFSGMALISALIFALATRSIETREPSAAARTNGKAGTQPPVTQPVFEDCQALSQRFADELGRLKEDGQTVSPAELASQASAENGYKVDTMPELGKRLDAEAIYLTTKPGVVIVGGLFKCNKCRHWHIKCSSGFVVHRDGMIVTNYHAVDGYKAMDAMGVMTDDGRVFAVKAVLAANRLNDLALLKIDATDLRALPVAAEVSVGATVYCLSHPVLPNSTANGFFSISDGIVCGAYTLHAEDKQLLKVLAVTAEYGPGSSGGPLINEHGAVVGVACQAVSLSNKENEKNVQIIWRLGRPSCSLLTMLSATTSKPAPSSEKPAPSSETPPPATPKAESEPPAASRQTPPAGADTLSVDLKPCELTSVGYYRPVRVMLTETPPVKPKAEPKYLSSKPLYGVVQVGEGAHNRFLVAIDEPTEGTSKIYIDRNGSGDLTQGPGNWDRSSNGTSFLGKVMIDVPYATGKVPYAFKFYRMKARQPNCVFCYRSSGREGEVTLDGRRYRVMVLDENGDGSFADLANGSIFIDMNQDGKLETTTDSAEYYRLDEPFNVRGKVWEVASLSADGRHMTLRRSKANVPIKPYLDVGYPAPAFSGRGLDGRPIDLKSESAKSKYVLLDFWASWCGPCRGEFPTLRRVYARYKNHGLTIIGVNLDSDKNKAIDAAKQASLAYQHIFDGLGWKNAVALLYRVHGIPQVYLLDSNMKIVGKNLRGPMLETRLRELLGPGDEAAAKAADQAEAAKKAEKKTKKPPTKKTP